MISREELIKFAKQLGFEITVHQLKRWHLQGLLPTPHRIKPKGKSGSLYLYPDCAISNLELLLTSPESKRNLDGLLIDIWLNGGQVDTEKFRKVILKPIKAIRTIVDKAKTFLRRLDREHSKKPSTFLPYTQPEDLKATIYVMMDVLSPRDEDRIWTSDGIDQLTGEDTAGDIADKVIGSDMLRYYSGIDETSEMMWNQMKDLLNIKQLLHAVESATEDEFDAVRKYTFIAEQVYETLSEISVLNKELRFLRALNYGFISKTIKRSLIISTLLTLYKNKDSRPFLFESIEAWNKEIDYMYAMRMYIKHMKKHPSLKKRTQWQKYFTSCDEKTFKSIQLHHFRFKNVHPDLLDHILSKVQSISTLV